MQTTNFLSDYDSKATVWDEMFLNGKIRKHYQRFFEYFGQSSVEEIEKKDELAKKLFMSQGVTFTVYSSGEGIEKIFPFDLIPRIITGAEWEHIEAGIK